MGNLETAAVLGSASRRESYREQMSMFREQMLDQLGRARTPAEEAEACNSLAVLDRHARRCDQAGQLAALGISGPAADQFMEEARARKKERKARRKWRKRCGLGG